MRKRLPVLLLCLSLAAGLLALGLFSHAQNDARSQELNLYVPGTPLDATLLNLDKRALDEAYEEQLKKLFIVWVSQQAKDPQAISNGLAIARRAYRQAASQISKREAQLLDKDRQDSGDQPPR